MRRHYSRLLFCWIRELEKGRYISVKFFDDVANLFFKGIPTACGITGHCQSQYVVEADGGVYACDFYVLDKYRAGNLTKNTLSEIFRTEPMQDFLREKRYVPRICEHCAYVKICGGGCKRMQNVMYYGDSGMYYGDGGMICGYKNFLDKNLKHLQYALEHYFTRRTF